MESLLKKFLLYKNDHLTKIYIDYYNIDGANCEVKFSPDDSGYYTEKININIWEIVEFLNE